MGSRKRQARERERREFEMQPDSTASADAFDRERQRADRDASHRESALEQKACGSKQRYASQHEAKLAIKSCEAHGSPKLFTYRCPYCDGWHLTHKRPRG